MKHVALIYDAKLPYDLKVVSGVASYLQEGAGFSIYVEETALKNQKLPDLRSWHGDGIIADFDDPGVAAAVTRSRIPAVGFGGGHGWYPANSRIPYFFNNQAGIARMAADHFLERGFRHFGYCGFPPTQTNGWSREREVAFARRVRSRGFACDCYRGFHKTTHSWNAVMKSFGAWLHSLPKPVAVMAANDKRAHHVLEACRIHNIRVPWEVAVIGVDNDQLLCGLTSPPLSSVEQDAKRIGYEAAALLDRMMRGEKPRRKHFLIDPVEIVTRQSSDFMAVSDQAVAKAMAFIQTHAPDRVRVPAVLKDAAVSRSSLEARFKAAIGYTIHGAIRKVQLDQARRIITATNLPIKEVAVNTGFRSVQHMTTLFRQAFGKTPARYRDEIVR